MGLNHTPWQVNEECPEQIVSAEENFLIAEIVSDSREKDLANAAFIVRAVNAHELMLDTLRGLENYFDSGPELDAIKQAIAKAEGK